MGVYNILLVTGLMTLEHRGRAMCERLTRLMEATGRFKVSLIEEFRNITSEYLTVFDAIFIVYDGKSMPAEQSLRFGEKTEEAVFDFVSGGKGICFYHSSVIIDAHWPDEWFKMMGAFCSMSRGTRRAPTDDFMVQTVNPEHPITKGLDREWMCVMDDLLVPVVHYPGSHIEVLAEVYDNIDFYRVPGWPPSHHPVEIPDGKLENLPGINTCQPVCWTNTYGKGRVFCTSLGHWESLQRINFITMLVRGTEWAASGQVTLDKPDRSGDNRFNTFPYYTGRVSDRVNE